MAEPTADNQLTGTGTGTGTGNNDGTGNFGSSGNSRPNIGTGTGNEKVQPETIKLPSETVTLIEATKSKRGRPVGSTNASTGEKSSKGKSKKVDENPFDVEGLFTTIIESMVVAKYGKPGEFTAKEREILDASMSRLMERIGIVNKIKNSPALDLAMIAYVFVCVGLRIKSSNTTNASPEDDFADELRDRKTGNSVKEYRPELNTIQVPDFTKMNNGNGNH